MAKAVTIYGIKNCDTMKKARAWLDGRGVAYGSTTTRCRYRARGSTLGAREAAGRRSQPRRHDVPQAAGQGGTGYRRRRSR